MHILTMLKDVQISQIIDCISHRWSPSIGDPSFMGWATVAAYALAASLSGVVGLRLLGRQRIFWLALWLLLGFLTINKQLDLQSALTATGRCIAQLQGWYDHRKMAQLYFIIVMAAFGVSSTVFLFWWMKDSLRQNWIALIGTGVLMTFILIRAAGFHHVDALINSRLASVKMNWVLELSGILLISLNALRLLGRNR